MVDGSGRAMIVSKNPKKRLLVLCPFPQGVAAGQRLKYEQYLGEWESLGFEIDVSSYMDINLWQIVYKKGRYLQKTSGVIRGHLRRLRDLFRVRHYDIVYIFMWVTPFGTSLMERSIRILAKKLIYDIEDNILSHNATSAKSFNPNSLISFLKGPQKARYLIRKADQVITSSPFLNDLCLNISGKSNCLYISSSVNTSVFIPATPYSNNKPVVIGWTGTFSSKVYLDTLRVVFQKLAVRISFKLKIISNFDYDLPGVDIEVVCWSRDREVEDLQSFDIGVYPLPIDDWVLGKSGLKAIQYMAFGLPTVATKVGTNPLLITHGVNGLLVETETEWIDALEQLVRDPELRRRMGETARAAAVANYSTSVIGKYYEEALLNMVREKL